MSLPRFKKRTKKLILWCLIIAMPLVCITAAKAKETAKRNADLKALEEMRQREIELNKWFEENKDRIYAEKLQLKEEALACTEELKGLIVDNSDLLDSFNTLAFSLPYETVRIIQKEEGYSSQPPIEELSKASPDLLETLDEIHEAGITWKEVNIWPGTPSSHFVILHEAAGGMSVCVTMDCPPYQLSPGEFLETIEVTEKWGIYWDVDSMDGI